MDGIKPDDVFWTSQENLERVRTKRAKELGLSSPINGVAPTIIYVDASNTIARWQMICLGVLITLTAEFVAIVAVAYF